MSDIEREAFEQWAASNVPDADFDLQDNKDSWPGQYQSYHLQCMWEGWQAARQAPASGEAVGRIIDMGDQKYIDMDDETLDGLPVDTKLYTHPPAKVPEGLRIHIERMLELHERRGVVLSVHMQELEELLTTPTTATIAGADSVKRCSWWKDMADWDGNTWEADCGACWVFIDEGPAQNEMNYCPKCGRKLSQLPTPPQEQ